MKPCYIKNLLDLSTAHMPSSVPDFGEVRFEPHAYGYVAWVTHDPEDRKGGIDVGVPEWLLPILQLAREHCCSLVLFDRDADTIDGLQTWDW